ncbi:MAG: ferredoxin, partial [Pseudomonadota bacterium]
WATKSGFAWGSPATLLVHVDVGLWVSYRGALALDATLALPSTPDRAPCAPCPAPCLSACPVGAIHSGGYDTDACRTHVRSRAGTACRTGGCLVRHACPAGAGAAPPPDQAGYHMERFLA